MTETQINVMIIEDDSTAAQIYEQFTKKLEHFTVVATAGSGEQALELLTIFTPQLILLDVFYQISTEWSCYGKSERSIEESILF
ncbi:response regulator [Priestia megaterium]